MTKYWPKRLMVSPENPPSGSALMQETSDSDEDDYDRARKRQVAASESGGCRAELKRYLDDPASDVTKDEDTVTWWAVSSFLSGLLYMI